jgi:myo-inositol-1(or 4)-monophosphatase
MEGQMKEFLRKIILQAGRITLEFRRNIGKLAIDRKARKDFVSEADRAVENFLIEQIHRQYPDHGIFGEETGTREGGEYRWIIDPIDGTTSFIHGQPFYCISIALQRNGQPVLAAVNAPVLGELFEAESGQGTTLNGEPISVSKQTRLEDSLLATAFACIRDNLPYNNLPYFLRILPQIRDIRQPGSAALDLCYIACGRFEGFWELNLKLYDIAAGTLIVSEAGGRVTDFAGGLAGLPGEMIATNGRIHDEMLSILSQTKAQIVQDAYKGSIPRP